MTDDPLRPRVDVVVVTWNTAELSARALRRLLDEERDCDLRLLVRDNASSDGTVERLAREVPEAAVDAGTENLGFAAGVNTVLKRSTAPWIFLLNSDAWPEPGALRTLIATAEATPRAAAVAPRLERPDGSLEHSTHPFPSVGVAVTSALWPRIVSRKKADALMLNGAWNHDRRRRVDWAVGAALLVRRNALDEIGDLDDSFFMYVEDLEWCWRAHKRGWEIWFEPDAVVRHVGNVSGAQRYGGRRTEVFLRNTHTFFRREHGRVAAAAYRAIGLSAAGAKWAGARVRGDRDLAEHWRGHVRGHLRGDDDRGPAPVR